MATYNQLSYGSQGSEVTELQKLLNQNGYTLDEDGIFGSKTQEAVRDYQQKNNLDVDGIVGTNTWGALTNANTGTANNATATTPADTGFKYDAYQPSDAVTQAQALLQQQTANKPGAYNSAWQGQLNDVIGQILNRDKFSYDLNADALYQQYANQYINQGRMAMMDTMGQAARSQRTHPCMSARPWSCRTDQSASTCSASGGSHQRSKNETIFSSDGSSMSQV